MRTIIITILLSIICIPLFAQKIDKYIGKVTFEKGNKNFSAEFNIEFSNLKLNDTIKLFLHKDVKINSISSNGNSVEYHLSDEKLLGEDNAILISSKNISSDAIQISYSQNINNIKNPNFQYNPNWIELNIYSTWFPLNINYGLFDYEISVLTNDRVVSSNVVNDTILKSLVPTYDIPIVVSNKIKKLPVENGKIVIFHYGVSDNIIKKVENKSAQFFSKYTDMFGSTNSENLSIAINSFNRTINYARPQFISSSIDDSYTIVNEKTLAHEIGHLWWNKADVGTWNDWLNEAFAEYSSLLIIRDVYGIDEYQNRLLQTQERFEGSPPIWNIELLNPNRNNAITYKGAYLLVLLEKQVGKKKMFDFLKQLHKLKIKTTDDFLKLLKSECDSEISNWFEMELRK